MIKYLPLTFMYLRLSVATKSSQIFILNAIKLTGYKN